GIGGLVPLLATARSGGITNAHVQEGRVKESKLVVRILESPLRIPLMLMRAGDPFVTEGGAQIKVRPNCCQNVFGTRFRRYLDQARFGLYEEAECVHAMEDDLQAGEVPLLEAF
ncbi:hypothetical protein, partial [Stenotrophomonas sp.]|uniref:hypothetical protein n=1 Tax=Stenotrophomonas sp. TaxID=69392 RepID=UPI0028A0D574